MHARHVSAGCKKDILSIPVLVLTTEVCDQ